MSDESIPAFFSPMRITEPAPTDTPSAAPEAFRTFAFVVDGEVGFKMSISAHPDFLPSIACLSSNPTIIELHGDDKVMVTPAWKNTMGWTFDGENFHPPVE